MFALMDMNTAMSTDIRIRMTVHVRKDVVDVRRMIRKKKTLHF